MHPSDVVRKYVRQGTLLADRYQVEGFIGSGAYGSIFSAIDTVTMERVAVKALPPPNQGVNATAVGRFRREMKVISSLRHANVISLYDFGETEENIVFMVLEYVDGPTLYDLVSDSRFSPEQALAVTRQIAQGLGAAHKLGVIHRDLKPQNIMLITDRSGDYHVKVLDFGMAKLLQRLNDESIIQLTREGVAVGTPRYIAPEQARGKEVGAYSDLYALGLLMYEMFTGARAVKADSIESAIMAHVSREPLDLPEIGDVPDEVRPLLWKLIEKNQKKRYQDADTVIDDIRKLEAQLAGRPIPRTRPTAPELGDDDEPTRIRSIHSAESLRLDYDRLNEFEEDEKKKRRRRRARRERDKNKFALRLPETGAEQFEALFCLAVAPVAFTFVSAHFFESGYILRLLMGAMPLVVAVVATVLARSDEWRWSVFRLWLIASAISLVGAHLLSEQLVRGLILGAAWYLEPFDFIPGVSLIQNVVQALARAHVSILVDLSPALADVARNMAVP